MSSNDLKGWRSYDRHLMDYQSNPNAGTVYDLIIVIVQTGWGGHMLDDLMLELWSHTDDNNYDRIYRLIEDIYNDVTINIQR